MYQSRSTVATERESIKRVNVSVAKEPNRIEKQYQTRSLVVRDPKIKTPHAYQLELRARPMPGQYPGTLTMVAAKVSTWEVLAWLRIEDLKRNPVRKLHPTVAALYVEAKGIYSHLPDVEVWDQTRDARQYAGPHPVVAHPPCDRWGSYWFGSPSSTKRFELGDDGGMFASALAAVRTWGGVLENPAGSRAWKIFGLVTPPKGGGWVAAGDFQGWTCEVMQGNYGHRAPKATWLYVAGLQQHELPVLRWGDAPPSSLPLLARTRTRGVIERMCRRERAATPPQFRDLLISIARATRRKPNPSAFPKSCSCGLSYTEQQWERLPVAKSKGHMDGRITYPWGEIHELRNCVCGSTMAFVVADGDPE